MDKIKIGLVLSQRVRTGIAVAFFLFICWIIYTADIGEVNPHLKRLKEMPYGDKVGHFMLYGMLVFLVNLALNGKRIGVFGRFPLLSVLLVSTFAIAEEFTQIAFATRNFELLDISCDLLGIALFAHLSERLNDALRTVDF